ncbi:MAG TPA: hypothetical protein VFY08_00405 [Actinomycetota bacterium]|nr:hypothetical protein [Actinomycetota bacterium]
MTRARLGALAVCGVVAAAVFVGGTVGAQTEDQRSALVVLVPGAGFDDLMAIPDLASLARAGGAGLLVNPDDVVEFGGSPHLRGETRNVLVAGTSLQALVERTRLAGFADDELLVIVIGADPSSGSAEKDIGNIGLGPEIGGVVVAEGTPETLFPETGEQGSLTSDSTRRDGVVTGGDVRATLIEYLGRAPLVSGDVPTGSPIEIIPGPPPFELHESYLAQRRMYVPIGTAGGIYLAIVGLGAIAALALGNHVPRNVRRIFGWGCLSVAALATALLAAGHLPDLTYATVVPFVALVTVFGTLAFAPLEHRDVLLIPAGLGIALLAYFAVEAVLAWTAALTPFVGGSELDGGRFYGLPNAFIGLLIGASLWIAQRLRSLAGFALLVAVALFAGLPYLGANLGGGVSLFAAAGLWLAIRERERLGLWRGIGVFVGVTALGAAVILAAHAVSPFETHVTRFEEQAGGLAGVFEKFGDRLQVGFDLIARNPFALIPVLGLPIAIAAVLRPPTPLRPSLQQSPAWRDAILVTLLAGIVAYLVNDSGPAAAGFAFGLGLGGLLGVSLLSEAGKMGEP